MQSQEKSNLMDRSPTTRLHLAAQAVGNEGLALGSNFSDLGGCHIRRSARRFLYWKRDLWILK
jgi:hypothetical protein